MSRHTTQRRNATDKSNFNPGRRRPCRDKTRRAVGLVAEALEQRTLLSLPRAAEAPAWTPWTSVLPAGSLVYQSTATGSFASPADTVPLTLNLEAGQRLSLLLQPSPTLQPQVELRDSSGVILASYAASSLGQAAWLQTLPVSAAGTYQVLLRSICGGGQYTLQASLNAAVETEPLTSLTNNSPATAQDLDSGFLSLGGNAQRAAVLGSGDTPGPLLLQADFSVDAQGFAVDNSGGGLWHLSSGHGSESGHSAPQSFYYGRNESASGGGTYNTGTRNSGSLLSPALSLPAGQSISLSFNYLLRTESSSSFDLAQLQINAGSGWSTLASYNRTAESSTWKATSVDLSAYAGKSVQLRWFFDTKDAMSNSFEGWYVDDVKLQCAAPSIDYYSFSLQAGETASVVLKKLASGTAHVAITDAAGTVLVQGLASSGNVDELLSGFQAPSPGRYYVRLSSDSGLPYQLMVLRNSAFDCEPNNSTSTAQDLTGSLTALGSVSGSDSDYYSLRLAAGERIRLSTRTPGDGAGEFTNSLDPLLELYDANGGRVASNDNGAADGRNASLVYQSMQGGSFKVKVGAANGSSGEYVLQLESLPPGTATPTTPDLQSESDTGVSSSDNITRLNNGLRFLIGNTVAGATVSLWADGQLIGSALASSSSTLITSNGTVPLSEGVHQFTATQQLPGQEASAASPALAVTIDTTAPTAPSSPALQAGSDTGISSSDRITQDTTPSFSVFASPYYRVYRNGTKVSGEYESSSTYTAPIQPEGSLDYAITAVDAAGNESPVGAAITVTIDTTAPAQPVALDLQAAYDSGASSSDNLTNQTTLGFDVAAGGYYRLYRNGTLVSGAYQTGSTCQISGNPDGVHSFTVAAVDAAGNVSVPSSPLQMTVDTVAARPSMPDLQASSDSGISNSDNITNVLKPVFDTSVSEAGTLHLTCDDGSGTVRTQIFTPGHCSISLESLWFGYTNSTNFDGTWTRDGVVVADLNLDGKLDLVGLTPSGFYPYLGRGDGTFVRSTMLATAGSPRSIIAADLNKDGKPDLITGNLNSNNVSVFLGNGDGTFQPESLLPAGKGTSFVTAADFNGDGTVDLAATNIEDMTVSIFLGRGGGSFAPQQVLSAGRMTRNIHAADLNADGKVDLVVGTIYSDALAVFLGRGDGTFAPATWQDVGGVQAGVATGDFNRDGQLDIVSIAWPNNVSLLLGNGDGTFASRRVVVVDSTPNAHPECIITADLNGDGNLDFATANYVDPVQGTLSVVLGNGDGTFRAVSQYQVPSLPTGIDCGDFNRDGNLDLVTAAWGDPGLSTFLAITSPLGDGPHTIRAWFEDLAGNRSALSDALAITIDTTPPASPSLFDLQAASDTGVSNTDNLTDDHTPTFDVQAGPYFRVYRDGVQVSKDYESGSTYTTPAQADGSYSYSIRAVDAAGNVSKDELKLQVTIGSMLPAAPDLLFTSDTGVSFEDDLTKLNNSSLDTALRFRVAPVAPGALVKLYADGKLIGSSQAASAEVAIVTDGKTPLADGKHTITWRATLPGQAEGPDSPALTLTIDTQSPSTPPMLDLTDFSDSGVSSTDNITNDNTPTLIATGSEYFRIYIDGRLISDTYQSKPLTTQPQPDGTYQFTAIAVDAAGNVSGTSAALPVTIDTVAPSQPAWPDLWGDSDTGYGDHITNDTTPMFGLYVGTDNYFRFFRDGVKISGDFEPGMITPGAVAVEYTAPHQPDGRYAYAVAAVDVAGNQSPMSDGCMVTIDTVAPTTAPSLVLEPASDSGVSNADNVTNATDWVFRLSAPEAGTLHLDVEGVPGGLYLKVPGAGSYTIPASLWPLDFRSQAGPAISGANYCKIADFNLDGNADLLLRSASGWSVALGKGNGTFGPCTSVLSSADGSWGLWPTIADFNGDKYPDLAIAREEAKPDSPYLNKSVTLILNKGDGTFQSPQAIPGSSGSIMPLAADLNADGLADLILVNRYDRTIYVLLSNGDGTFRPDQSLAIGSWPVTACIADVNGDGKIDVLTAGEMTVIDAYRSKTWVSVYLGNGDGTLRSGPKTESTFPYGFGAGDFNKDGRLDAIVIGSTAGVLLGKGDGTFAPAIETPLGEAPSNLTIADFDGDGNLDFSVTCYEAMPKWVHRVWLFRGKGDGTFLAPNRYCTDVFAESTAVGDVNNDGRPDLVAFDMLTKASMVFLNTATPASDGPHRVTAWFEDLAGNAAPKSQPLTLTLDTTAPIASIAEVIPNPRTSGIDSLTITFSEPVSGFDLADLKFCRDGGPNLLTPNRTLTTSDNITWTLNNLGGLTNTIGTYTLTLAAAGSGIIDSAGNPLNADASRSFTVSNTSPVLQPIGNLTVDEGKLLTFTAQAQDRDLPAQTLTFSLLDAPTGASIDPVTGVFSWTPTFAQAGQYTFKVCVSDNGLPSLNANQPLTIIVQDVYVPQLQVTNITPTPSGFDIQFNMPIDVAQLNLYDGVASKGRAADLTIAGAKTGAVAGTAIWEAATNTLHFVKTGGLLAADSYSVTLFSRADGFVGLDGDKDGNAGGNFVQSVNVAATTGLTATMPDIARGPKQSFSLPIRLSDTAGVQSFDAELRFDPTLLNVSEVERAAGLPGDWTAVMNVLAPGLVKITAYGTTALTAGAKDLLLVKASVPSTASYAAAGMLQLQNVVVNDTAVVGDTAVQAVAYLGDASGNKNYTGMDAAFIANVVIGAVKGFDAFPTIDPVIIGDVNGNGSIGGLDASYVAQKSVGMAVTQIPDLPAATPVAPLAAKATATTNSGICAVSIPLVRRPLPSRIQRPAPFAPWVRKVSEGLFSRRAIGFEILN